MDFFHLDVLYWDDALVNTKVVPIWHFWHNNIQARNSEEVTINFYILRGSREKGWKPLGYTIRDTKKNKWSSFSQFNVHVSTDDKYNKYRTIITFKNVGEKYKKGKKLNFNTLYYFDKYNHLLKYLRDINN